jgi:hypothetical protein
MELNKLQKATLMVWAHGIVQSNYDSFSAFCRFGDWCAKEGFVLTDDNILRLAYACYAKEHRISVEDAKGLIECRLINSPRLKDRT